MQTAGSLRPISEEFEGADLGDERRNNRLLKIASALECDPAGGFPRAMRGDAELEAFYRFINNGSFSSDEILDPHLEAALQRACEAGEVLAIHDSSYFQPAKDAPRKEMGIKTANKGRGFVAHVALLATMAGTPLGLGHLETLVRTGAKGHRSARRQGNEEDSEKVTQRWLRSMQAIDEERAGRIEVDHVIDAEGDFFELLSAMQSVGARFVIRAAHQDRIVTSDGSDENLRQVVDRLEPRTWRKIQLGERRYNERLKGPHSRRRHPQRDARQARVAIASSRIVIPARSRTSGDGPVSVNVVRVWEPKPPKGQPPVEWILLTSESVQSAETLLKVVDIYRKRWLIEDFFKALKTGCSLEKRQVASYAALQKVLALLAPIAYRLLLLRGIHRERSAKTPARVAFDPVDLMLIAQAQRQPTKTPTTLHEAIMLLARLGGHIRNNGLAGWMN